jgi:8-oxo-dGTP diphosphatase
MVARDKAAEPIQAAGGIVSREGPSPCVAIVQLRKDKAWVLPKGKLKPGEDALAAAKREVTEETGHDVVVHEYLGAMLHAAGSRPKTTQFWRMQAVGAPVRKLMRDVRAVKWVPLDRAIETLTHEHERAFLANVAPAALEAAAAQSRRGIQGIGPKLLQKFRAWSRRLMRGT